MDCRQAQEILSNRHPSGLPDVPEADGALVHCDSCPVCAEFARALAALGAIPRPEVPDHIVRITLDAIQRERPAETTEESEDFRIHRAEEDMRSKGWWIGRFAITASAAVVFLGAVLVSVNMMTAPLPRAADEIASAPQALSEMTESDRAADVDDESAVGSTEATVDTVAPDYVAFGGVIYRVLGQRAGTEIATETVGVIFTAKDDPSGVPDSYPVFQDVAKTALFIESATDDTYVLIVPVTRTYEETTYALVADASLDAYGEWPDLPSYMPKPALPDGSPVFTEDGKDAQGTLIYVRVGVLASQGIAVGPGTSPSDPSSGNPNWTWWEPY